MRLSHIEQAEPLLLPMHFKSFEDFLAFAINDGTMLLTQVLSRRSKNFTTATYKS